MLVWWANCRIKLAALYVTWIPATISPSCVFVPKSTKLWSPRTRISYSSSFKIPATKFQCRISARLIVHCVPIRLYLKIKLWCKYKTHFESAFRIKMFIKLNYWFVKLVGHYNYRIFSQYVVDLSYISYTYFSIIQLVYLYFSGMLLLWALEWQRIHFWALRWTFASFIAFEWFFF